MDNKYEINNDTFAVISLKNGKTRIIEYDRDFILDYGAYEVMEHSCGYFGSSYQGRVYGSKKILGSNYKVPIIVEESNDLIFFPTTSPEIKECSWFSLNSIDCINKNDKYTQICLKNGKKVFISVSKNSLENQLLRATRLKYLINDRKVAKK